MSTNVNEVYLGKTGKNQHKEYYGQQTMHGDAEKLHGWDLLTNGGILMYPHHDADGLSTYVTVRSGSKIWCFINSPGSSQLPKEQLFKAWDGIFRDNIKLGFMEYNVATVVLERGDMLYHVKRDHQGTREAQKVIQALKAILKVQNAAEGLEVGPWWDPGPVCDISGLSDGSIL
ncbi:hypothetical protein M404DRAFT_7532 [Pisolithus tinctorius Marx 270]|uniref:Uncharacterized protein n=1 Tax=Pisolithus tinctorius Marx 270 TaxID=870435 RepID=A0A0C3PNA5_PISTI|nr:hypothetical protein M404DRAFT_7532 [Pisolithus tinctorius Marx 270]